MCVCVCLECVRCGLGSLTGYISDYYMAGTGVGPGAHISKHPLSVCIYCVSVCHMLAGKQDQS